MISSRLIFFALFPFACGYFLSYLLRAVNAVVAPDLVQEFSIGPGELGLLTSAYLLAFSLFQLPLGIMLDRYGPRRVQTVLLCIAGAGCLAFAMAPGFFSLVAARAVIGLGFSAGLMASYKSSADWIPLERRSLANTAIMSMGALGIVVATEPTAYLAQQVGWRNVFLIFSTLIFAAAAFIFFAAPDKEQPSAGSTLRQQTSELIQIMRLPLFWRIAPILALAAGIPIALQTLWAGPWFRDVMGMDRFEVARSLLWMAVSFMLGILAIGIMADRLQKIGIGPMKTMLGCLIIHLGAQFIITMQWQALAFPAWLALAAVGQAAILAFPWFSSRVGERLAGRSNATINFAMFVVAFAAQYVVGFILGFFPNDRTSYSSQGYATATGIFLILQTLALLWYLFAPIGSIKDEDVKPNHR
jgi:predicted MFS family arabinose efflux permease